MSFSYPTRPRRARWTSVGEVAPQLLIPPLPTELRWR